MVRFVVERLSGSGLTREEIDGPALRIGRGVANDIRSDEAAVALEHAVIESAAAAGFTITDLGSLTGTFVNGNAIESAGLAGGDRIEIGNLRLAVADTAAGRPLLLRVSVAGKGTVTATGIDYERALSLRRSWLSKGTVAVVVAAVTLTLVAQVVDRDGRRAVRPGPLSSAHARVPALDRCEACHSPFQPVSAASCLQCHQTRSHGGAADHDCATCHAEHRPAVPRCTEGCHEGLVFGSSHPEFTRQSVLPDDHPVEGDDELCSACHVELTDRFAHAQHRLTGCTECHAAAKMPSQRICAECHGARTGVPASECTTCHEYHGNV
jgi:hypothetical protein